MIVLLLLNRTDGLGKTFWNGIGSEYISLELKRDEKELFKANLNSIW